MTFIQSLSSTLNKILLVGASLLILFSLSALASAQTVDDDETIKIKSDLVLLNIGVADPKGRPVLDLSQNDFVVYEDGVRQTIQSFEPTEAPFSLVLLLDMSGSTLNFRTTLKQAATRFIDDVVTNGAHVRTGEGMGSPFLLSQAEPRKWRSDGGVTTTECLPVIHAVHVIFVGEVVVYAKGSQVPSRVAWHQGLE